MSITSDYSSPSSITEEYIPTHPNFRSKICRHWLRGYCNRADKCNFAHGFNQVKKKPLKTCISIPSKVSYELEKGKEKKEFKTMTGLIDNYDIIHHDEVSDFYSDFNVDDTSHEIETCTI